MVERSLRQSREEIVKQYSGIEGGKGYVVYKEPPKVREFERKGQPHNGLRLPWEIVGEISTRQKEVPIVASVSEQSTRHFATSLSKLILEGATTAHIFYTLI